jgi:hypothetical protein
MWISAVWRSGSLAAMRSLKTVRPRASSHRCGCGRGIASSALSAVKRRQAMHVFRAQISGLLHHPGVDLIGHQQLDPFSSFFLGLAHREPDIGIDEINALDRVINIFSHSHPCASLRRYGLCFCPNLFARPAGLGRAKPHIHAHLAPPISRLSPMLFLASPKNA